MNKYQKVLTHHFQSTLVLGKDGSVTGISQRRNTWFLWGVVLSILINLLAEKKYNYHLQWCGSEKLTKSSRIHFLNIDLFAKTFCYKFSLLLAQYNLSWSPHVTPIKICRIYPICSFLLVPTLHVMLKVLRYVSINSVGFFCFILFYLFFFSNPEKKYFMTSESKHGIDTKFIKQSKVTPPMTSPRQRFTCSKSLTDTTEIKEKHVQN